MWDFTKYKNKIALIEDNGIELTYNDLVRDVKDLSNYIGDRCLCFILCEN